MAEATPAPGTARVLWVALVSSVVLLYVSHRLMSVPVAPRDPTLFPSLVVVALTNAAASLFYPGFLLRQAAKKLALETREVPGAITPNSPNATRRVFVDAEKARAAALRLYQVNLVLSLALAETVALLGFVLGFHGFPDEQVLPFFGAALVLMALRFPGPRAAEKTLERALGASFP